MFRAIKACAALLIGLTLSAPVIAASPDFSFPSIDGGTLEMGDWAGRPVLVVNTASRCGFTPQYDGLQALYDKYRDRGLVVLAVPSQDFRQELASEAEVKEFCEVNFGLDIPMTTIQPVKGAAAHPFYKWVEQEAGWSPGWTFCKVLIGPDGAVAGTWGSLTKPGARAVRREIEALLPRS
jgi:glutathione peroxidase